MEIELTYRWLDESEWRGDDAFVGAHLDTQYRVVELRRGFVTFEAAIDEIEHVQGSRDEARRRVESAHGHHLLYEIGRVLEFAASKGIEFDIHLMSDEWLTKVVTDRFVSLVRAREHFDKYRGPGRIAD